MWNWFKKCIKSWNNKRIRTSGGKVIMSELMWDIIHEGSEETKRAVVAGKEGDKITHKGKTYTIRYGNKIGIL